MVTDGNYSYHAEHFTMYIIVKSLSYIPGTNMILHNIVYKLYFN